MIVWNPKGIDLKNGPGSCLKILIPPVYSLARIRSDNCPCVHDFVRHLLFINTYRHDTCELSTVIWFQGMLYFYPLLAYTIFCSPPPCNLEGAPVNNINVAAAHNQKNAAPVAMCAINICAFVFCHCLVLTLVSCTKGVPLRGGGGVIESNAGKWAES